MAKADDKDGGAPLDDAPPPEPVVTGYRLKRGFVLFDGFRQTPFATGQIVAAGDPVVSRLFSGGADLEPVME